MMVHTDTRSDSLAEYISRINRVLEYIEQHLADDLSLSTLARESFFSAFHFHRIFQGIVGETPVEFAKRIRLERSALMLMHNPTQSITQIAFACGFSSSATFSRAFKEKFGSSPREWRHNSKNRKLRSKKRKAATSAMEYLLTAARSTTKQQREEILMNVTIKEMQAKHIAYVANLEGYDQETIERAWARLTAWAGPLGLMASAEALGISFDNPDITPKNKCRYYACITIPCDTAPPKDIGVMDIPAGRYAVLPFDGVAEGISAAYRTFYSVWLPQSGFQPDDRPCFEIYHSDPREDPEGHFVMDICMPIKTL